MTFRLDRTDTTLCIHGTDDTDRPFACTLDRVWAMNLAAELDDWLSRSTTPPPYQPPRVVPCVGCEATGLIGDKVCPLCHGQAVRRA